MAATVAGGFALAGCARPATPAATNSAPSLSAAIAAAEAARPHTGLDADYGLYLPVVVDDPTERGGYDAEWIVMLDDWTDRIGKTPQQIYDDLRGHTFQIIKPDGSLGARKDTTIVLPMQESASSSSPTTPASGCCTATTPITKPA